MAIIEQESIDPNIENIPERFSELVIKRPELKIHLTAIDKLQQKSIDEEFIDEDREAFLLYALWTEDPAKAVEVAQDLGLSERQMNESIDLVTYDPDQYGDRLLAIVAELQPKPVLPLPLPSVSVVIPQSLPEPEVIVEKKIVPPQTVPLKVEQEVPQIAANPLVRRSPEYAAAVTNRETSLPQTYDHPLLTRKQEYIVFEALRKGTPIEELMKDEELVSTVEPEDRPAFERVFAQSNNIEDFITSCSLRLVHVIADGFGNRNALSLRDRINVGNTGLLEAVRKWDHTQGTRFSSYAVWSIRSAIAKSVYDQRSSIRVPAYVQQDMGKARWVSEAFNNLFGRNPTLPELRQQLLANTEIPRWRVNTLIRVIESKISEVGSLNKPISPDGDGEDEVGDFIPDAAMDVEGTVVGHIADEELRRETRRALSQHLTPEEEHVIKVLYGLYVPAEKTPEELAKEMGTSKEEIEFIERRSLLKLRRDRWLRERWEEDMPSFLFRMSAERAAFRLGLFDDEMVDAKEQVERSTEISEKAQAKRYLPESSKIVTTVAEAVAVPIIPQAEALEETRQIQELTFSSITEALRSQGLTDEQIAREFAVPSAIVSGRLFLKSGEIALSMSDESVTNTVEVSTTPVVEVTSIAAEGSLLWQVKELRIKGLSNGKIAEQLGVPVGSVGVYASRLVQAGEIPSRRHEAEGAVAQIPREQIGASGKIVYAQVRELRKQGFTNVQIAETLGTSQSVVGTYASMLIQNGEIEPLPKGRPGTQSMSEKVKELRDRGFDNVQISEKLGIPYEKVGSLAAKLIRQGEIARLPHGRLIRKEGTLISKVKELRSQGFGNQEIAEMLGKSYGSVAVAAHRLLEKGEVKPLPQFGHRPKETSQDSEEEEPNPRKKSVGEEREEAKSEMTELVRQYLEAHPRPSYKETMNRFFAGRQRRPTGRTPESVELDRQVLDLLNQGTTRKKIGEQLGRPMTTIDASVHRMIQLGEYTANRAVSSEAVRRRGEYNETQERIQELIRQGQNVTQIAEDIDSPVAYVQMIVYRLGRRGQLSYSSEQTRTPKAGFVDKRASIPNGALTDIYGKVADMRNQGLSNKEIADAVGVPIHRVEVYASNLIRAGVIPAQQTGGRRYEVGVVRADAEIPKRLVYDKIAELRSQGLSNQQISAQLNISAENVSRMASKLIRAGVIKPRRIASDEREAIRLQIIELRNQGLRYQEIAERLEQPYNRVYSLAVGLIKEGKIKSTGQGGGRVSKISAEERRSNSDIKAQARFVNGHLIRINS